MDNLLGDRRHYNEFPWEEDVVVVLRARDVDGLAGDQVWVVLLLLNASLVVS